MNCFGKKGKLNVSGTTFQADETGSLKKFPESDDEDEDEGDSKEMADLAALKKIFPLNQEIKEKLLNKSEEDIITLFDKANADNFDADSCQFEGGNSLLHEIAIAGTPKVLKKLVELNPNLNVLNDEENTPMISLLKTCEKCLRNGDEKIEEETEDESDGGRNKIHSCEKHFLCLEILLSKNVDKDMKNKIGLSALSYATMCRDQKREEYLKKLLEITEEGSVCSKLYQTLEAKLDLEFVEELNKLRPKIDDSKLNEFMFRDHTFLQIVCKYGMIESSKRLVELGTDINHAPIRRQKPIQLCCIFARPDILQLLLDKNAHEIDGEPVKSKHDRNLIHLTMKHMPHSKDAYLCLKILLDPKYKLNINEQDAYKRTPLHYAVIRDNDDCVVELLENEALIDVEDLWKQTPLMNISESAMKKYLDKMVTDGKEGKGKKRKKKGKADKTQTRKLTFNFDKLFRMVKRKEKEFYSFPTDLLIEVKNIKRLRNLIEHPIFSIIIYFKWINIRFIFYLYLLLYFLFSILFTCYIYLSEDGPERRQNSFLRVLMKFSTGVDVRMLTIEVKLYFIIPLAFLLLIFLFLETLKLIQNKYRYFHDLDNIVRLLNIVLGVIVMICLNSTSFPYCTQLKAFSVLTTWFELFLVIGKHPQFSFYVTIFRSASVNLLKFISVHFILLIGFALCFHILFRSADSDNVFTNPLNAFFKTIVMLTSEFDASDIPFTKYQGFSHVIFIAYIFLATIVLFNLMIGIAFKEVEQMEKNPFLYKSLAQIYYIKHFEENFSKNIIIRNIYDFLLKLTCCCCCVKGKATETDGREKSATFELTMTVKDKLKVFNNDLVFRTYPEEKVEIKHNHVRSEETDSKNNELMGWLNPYSNYVCSCFRYNLNDRVIENAQKIVSKRFSKNEELKEQKSSAKALESIKLELSEVKKLILNISEKKD